MSTITTDQQNKITKTLEEMPVICIGLGTREAACSVAAINLALSGELIDDIPACMSEMLGGWINQIQEAMPASVRNSQRWRSLLPLAAGTGREWEKERLSIIMEWMWSIVLPQLLPIAKEKGFSVEWARMLRDRDNAAAACAASASRAKAASAAAAAAHAAHATYAASASSAIYSAVTVAYTAISFVTADRAQYWENIDPCGLLEKLITADQAR